MRQKIKDIYESYELIILGGLIMAPLILGIFINVPWLVVTLNIIGLLAVIKFIFTASPKNIDAYINELLPERIEFEGQVYIRGILHHVYENDSYWSVDYLNEYGNYLPHLNDEFRSIDYGQNIPLELFVNIVHSQLKSYNYV